MKCIYQIKAPNGARQLGLSESPLVNIKLLISFGDREDPKHGYLVNILYNLKQDCLRVQEPSTLADLNHRSHQRPLRAIQDVENLMDFVMLSRTRMISSWHEEWAKFVGGLPFYSVQRQMQSLINDLKKLSDTWNAFNYGDKVHVNKWPVIAEYKDRIYFITNLYAILNLEDGVVAREVSGVMLERTEEGKFNRHWFDPTSHTAFSEVVEVCSHAQDQEAYFTDRAMSLVLPEALESKLFNLPKYSKEWKSISFLTMQDLHKQILESIKKSKPEKSIPVFDGLNLKTSIELRGEEEKGIPRMEALKILLKLIGEDGMKILNVELTNEERVELGLQPL